MEDRGRWKWKKVKGEDLSNCLYTFSALSFQSVIKFDRRILVSAFIYIYSLQFYIYSCQKVEISFSF